MTYSLFIFYFEGCPKALIFNSFFFKMRQKSKLSSLFLEIDLSYGHSFSTCWHLNPCESFSLCLAQCLAYYRPFRFKNVRSGVRLPNFGPAQPFYSYVNLEKLIHYSRTEKLDNRSENEPRKND